MMLCEQTLDQVLGSRGIAYEQGKNFSQITRGLNVWPVIIERETAILALQYQCDKGPPFVVVRMVHTSREFGQAEYASEIWYEVGGTNHCQESDRNLPTGFFGLPKKICIDPNLAASLIAEGLIWLQGDLDQEQIHCYYTGPGSFFEKNRKHLVSSSEQNITKRRRDILINHVRAQVDARRGETEQFLLDAVKKGYQKVGLLLPADDTILAAIRSACIKK